MMKTFIKQKLKYSCGAVCLCNLFMLLLNKTYKIAGTNKQGTDEYDICGTLDKYDLSYDIIKEYKKDKGIYMINKLLRELRKGNKAILAVDNASHWVLASSFKGDKIIITDPANDDKNFEIHNKRTFIDRWWNHTYKIEKPQYFAIVIKK